MGINEEFLNWCENKWENEFKAQNLFSKLSNEDIDFLKNQYEARLKADMVAMLTELQLEIEENVLADDPSALLPFLQARETCVAVIQQKINALKGEQNDESI